MYFDTHAHYDDEAFDADRETLLASMEAASVHLIVDPGCDEASSRRAMELAHAWPFVYAAVGWHPEHAETFDERSVALLRGWAADPRVKAIGEIGLDYHYETPPREMQKQVFSRQLELAGELGLPVIVHDREAHADSLALIRRFPGVTGVFHCFSGSAELARQLVQLGWYVGFTGVVTFKNARRALEAAAACPIERILLETDAPYMAPVPYRGKRCDSRMLPYMAQAIAQVRQLTAQEVAQAAAENGKRLFRIE